MFDVAMALKREAAVQVDAGVKLGYSVDEQLRLLYIANKMHCTIDNVIDPQDTTPAPPSTEPSRRRTILTYWSDSLQTDSLVKAQLLLLSFSTGIQDAISFPDFRCFASNQTGNTVLFAVAISGANVGLFNLMNTSISLVAFVTGAFAAGQLGHLLGKRRRYWHVLSQVVQTCLVVSAAWIQLVLAERLDSSMGYLVLMLLALSSGVQVGTARAMEVPEITTAMATAAWVDLVIDPQLFMFRNLSRNRRLLFILALVAGSFAGAFMREKVGSATAILVSGIVKMVVAISMLFARADATANSTSRDVEKQVKNQWRGVIDAADLYGCCENAGLYAKHRRQNR